VSHAPSEDSRPAPLPVALGTFEERRAILLRLAALHIERRRLRQELIASGVDVDEDGRAIRALSPSAHVSLFGEHDARLDEVTGHIAAIDPGFRTSARRALDSETR
jgi:hypothetical protein